MNFLQRRNVRGMREDNPGMLNVTVEPTSEPSRGAVAAAGVGEAEVAGAAVGVCPGGVTPPWLAPPGQPGPWQYSWLWWLW